MPLLVSLRPEPLALVALQPVLLLPAVLDDPLPGFLSGFAFRKSALGSALFAPGFGAFFGAGSSDESADPLERRKEKLLRVALDEEVPP